MHLAVERTQKIVLHRLPPQSAIMNGNFENHNGQDQKWRAISLKHLPRIKTLPNTTLQFYETCSHQVLPCSNSLEILSLKRTRWRTCMTKERLLMCLPRLPTHDFDTAFVVPGHPTPKQLSMTLQFRRSRFLQYKKFLETLHQTINTNPDRRSRITANRRTIGPGQIISNPIQPALQLAACDRDLNHQWWCVSTHLVRKHCPTTLLRVLCRLCLRWVRPVKIYVLTLHTSRRSAPFWKARRNYC